MVVYRATDLSLERPVALELIAPELASEEGFRKRVQGGAPGGLGNAHVLSVHAAGEAEGQLYLAMRHVEGDTSAPLSCTARPHPVLIPHEVPGNFRRCPVIPAARGRERPAYAGNPRLSPLTPEEP
jgi:hypothetical protein